MTTQASTATSIGSGSMAATSRSVAKTKTRSYAWLVPTLYILFLLLPIYWLVNMSFKTNTEITATFTLWPRDPTLRNYIVIFTDPAWYSGYINSILYVVLNTIISISVALPAAYAFSRLRFVGV